MKKQFLLILIIILLAGCGDMDIITLIAPEPEESADEDNIPFHVQINPPLRRDFDDFDRAIPIPPVTAELALIYNRDAEGDYIREYTQPDMADTLDGYVSDNYDFFETVLMPEILPKLDSLKGCEKYQAVNALTLFLHESFQEFFGLSYYRWGGDITDRDQPQVSGHTRSTKKYGMDCSGFAASPYEAAVCLGILDSTQAESYFSWFGFRYLCENDARYSDSGGRNGSSNNHRLEVFEFAIGGRLIATINAGTEPTSYQLSQMQAGDVVTKSGHAGILVEIEDELFFLESGGGTLSEGGLYTPYRAKEALADFAAYRTTRIYRCLPDAESTTGIVGL